MSLGSQVWQIAALGSHWRALGHLSPTLTDADVSPSVHGDLAKCNWRNSLPWMALGWVILFPDGRYHSHKIAALLVQRAFSVFNLTWRATWPTTHADQRLSLGITFSGAFQAILAESASIVGRLPGSCLHGWLSDKIPDKLAQRKEEMGF